MSELQNGIAIGLSALLSIGIALAFRKARRAAYASEETPSPQPVSYRLQRKRRRLSGAEKRARKAEAQEKAKRLQRNLAGVKRVSHLALESGVSVETLGAALQRISVPHSKMSAGEVEQGLRDAVQRYAIPEGTKRCPACGRKMNMAVGDLGAECPRGCNG